MENLTFGKHNHSYYYFLFIFYFLLLPKKKNNNNMNDWWWSCGLITVFPLLWRVQISVKYGVQESPQVTKDRSDAVHGQSCPQRPRWKFATWVTSELKYRPQKVVKKMPSLRGPTFKKKKKYFYQIISSQGSYLKVRAN